MKFNHFRTILVILMIGESESDTLDISSNAGNSVIDLHNINYGNIYSQCFTYVQA